MYGLYYLCSENKGADQLRDYREADLRLCFRICKTLVFSWRGPYIGWNLGVVNPYVTTGRSFPSLSIGRVHFISRGIRSKFSFSFHDDTGVIHLTVVIANFTQMYMCNSKEWSKLLDFWFSFLVYLSVTYQIQIYIQIYSKIKHIWYPVHLDLRDTIDYNIILSIPEAGETAETPVKRYCNTGKVPIRKQNQDGCVHTR